MQMFYKHLLLKCVFAFLLFPLNLPAQQPYMWHITDEEGLPSMTVYHVIQDTRGFMWFGTEVGVCRFDGRTFKRYPAPSAKARSGTSLSEDKYGNIWFRNFAKQLFKIEKERVVELKIPEESNNLLAYLHTTQDSVMVMDWNYTYISHTKHTNWRKIATPNVEMNWEMYNTKDNNLFLLTEAGIFTYKNGFFKLFDKTESPKRFFAKNKKTFTFQDELNRLVCWENGKKTILPYVFEALKKQIIHSFYIDNQNNFWFSTATGLFGYDKAGKPLFAGKPLLPNIDVSHILQDREGSYWISTLKDGVYVMPNLYVHIYNTQNSNLPADAVNCLSEQNAHLLLGFNNGTVGKFSVQKGITHLYETGGKQQVEALYYHTKHQKLYVSAGKMLIFEPDNPQSIYSYQIGAVKKIAWLNDQDMIFAAGADARIVRTKPTWGTPISTQNVWHQSFEKDAFNQNIYSLIINRKRNRSVWVNEAKQVFWLASIDGLMMCEAGKPMREVRDTKNKSIYAISFTESIDGTLWVGTIEQGLYAIKNNKVVQHFTQENGLAGNFCRGLWADGYIIWVNTGKGIQRYDIKTGEITHFNRHDGLHTYDISDIHILHDTLWVATPKGLLIVHTDSLKRNLTPPLIYIQAFKVFEIEQKQNDNYTLTHDKNNVKIEFQGLAYRSRGEFKYKYRMLGLDSTWIFTDNTNNFARYPSLPTGVYEFQVKAVNEDGIESEGMAIIQIIILPPWWQTWWASLLWLSMLVGSLWLIFWWRLRRVQARNHIEQALRSSQLATLKVQMNPHFIFNALNSIQEFIWLNEKRLANQYLGKFADLMRLTLDMSNESYVSLHDEIKVLNLYLELEGVRFENLAYQFTVNENIDTNNIYIPSMLIQPYVENAIKHGLLHLQEQRNLSISMSQNEAGDMIFCTIQDNGIGRKRSNEIQNAHPRKHKSFALSATQKRLELLNYGHKKSISVRIIDLANENGKALGTKVELQIPIQA